MKKENIFNITKDIKNTFQFKILISILKMKNFNKNHDYTKLFFR